MFKKYWQVEGWGEGVGRIRALKILILQFWGFNLHFQKGTEHEIRGYEFHLQFQKLTISSTKK